jgi:hypothetical protein
MRILLYMKLVHLFGVDFIAARVSRVKWSLFICLEINKKE